MPRTLLGDSAHLDVPRRALRFLSTQDKTCDADTAGLEFSDHLIALTRFPNLENGTNRSHGEIRNKPDEQFAVQYHQLILMQKPSVVMRPAECRMPRPGEAFPSLYGNLEGRIQTGHHPGYALMLLNRVESVRSCNSTEFSLPTTSGHSMIDSLIETLGLSSP
jgi:hypothetical protein